MASLRDEKAQTLVERVTEAVRARRDGKDGKDGQIIVQTDETAVRALREEIAQLKAQALQPKNDSDPIPRAIGDVVEEIGGLQKQLSDVRAQVSTHLADLHRRIIAIEERSEIVSSEPAELQDEINELGRELGSMSAAILQHIVTLQKRCDAQDARFAELPQVVAQLQRERRA